MFWGRGGDGGDTGVFVRIRICGIIGFSGRSQRAFSTSPAASGEWQAGRFKATFHRNAPLSAILGVESAWIFRVRLAALSDHIHIRRRPNPGAEIVYLRSQSRGFHIVSVGELGDGNARQNRPRYPRNVALPSCWLLGATSASELSPNRACGSSQTRRVVGEFFPDVLGLPASADKPFVGIVGVSSFEIRHSHLN